MRHLFIIGVLLSGLCMLTFMLSCAGIQTSKICTNIPAGQESVICQIAEKVETTPEAVATIVKVADLLLLNETHTAQEAWDFFTSLEDKIAEVRALNGATYDQLVGYAVIKYFDLPPKVRVAIAILKQFYTVDTPELGLKLLSDYDWKIILDLLADQKAAIAPFI